MQGRFLLWWEATNHPQQSLWFPSPRCFHITMTTLGTFTVIGVKDNSLSLTLRWCWKIICVILCRCAGWISISFSLSSQLWKATFKMAALPNRLYAPAFFSCSWGCKGIIRHQYLFVPAVTISSFSLLPPSYAPLFTRSPKITLGLVVHSHLLMRLLSLNLTIKDSKRLSLCAISALKNWVYTTT